LIDVTTRLYNEGNEGVTKCIASEIRIGSVVTAKLNHQGVELSIVELLIERIQDTDH
jgi:hypothetical protein